MASARFKVDPRLASLLGEAYRSSEEALRELVDNAWDADAERVSVTLPSAMTSEPIVIEDDGTGMTEKELREEYLYVANDRRTRKGEKTLGKKRPVKGRKGIGKFAGLMTASAMRLETCAMGRRTVVTIEKSNLFAAKKGDLERIDLPIVAEDCDPAQHGTKITLTGLAQNLTFPSPEKLKQILVVEYDRKEQFRVTVNGEPVAIEDIPGDTTSEAVVLPGVGKVGIKFTISESKPLKHPGIVVRVGGKIVGRPSMLGLEEDETIPAKLLKRIYGEIEADGLGEDVTADWGAIVENSVGLSQVREWAREKLAGAVKRTFSKEVSLQKARIAKDVQQGLDRLPENRRTAAERAINRVLERFFGDSDEKIRVVVTLMLEAFENDDYWVVLKRIDDATKADVAKLAEALGDFGIVDLAVVAKQATRRLAFLDDFEALVKNPITLEKEVHTAIEKNLWLLGSGYRAIASNKTLAGIVRDWLDKDFAGDRANKRPDLFLAPQGKDGHLLVEFKRPSHAIGRDDENQAVKYRDDLAALLPGKTIAILMVGGSRDTKVATQYKTDVLAVVSYLELVATARDELSWLLDQLKNG